MTGAVGLHPNGRELIARLRDGGRRRWCSTSAITCSSPGPPAAGGDRAARRAAGDRAHRDAANMMTAGQANCTGRCSAGSTWRSRHRRWCGGPAGTVPGAAFFTRPSPAEADYIHGAALRFAELRTGLLDPGRTVPFLEWLQARVVERRGPRAPGSLEGAQVPWTRFERTSPRWPARPSGCTSPGSSACGRARVGEEHRHPLTAAEWVALSATSPALPARQRDPRDERALDAIRRAVPRLVLADPGGRAGASPGSTGCWPGRRARPGLQSRSSPRSPPSSGRGCGAGAVRLRGRRRVPPADLAGVLPAGSGDTRLVLRTSRRPAVGRARPVLRPDGGWPAAGTPPRA